MPGTVGHAFNLSTEFEASLVHTVPGQTGAHETLSQMNKVEREVVNLKYDQSKNVQTCFPLITQHNPTLFLIFNIWYHILHIS